MRVAVPVWNGRISPVFDTAQRLLTSDVEGGQILGRREEDIREGLPQRRIAQLAEAEVATLICGAISRPLAGMVAASGIEVIPFVAGEVEEVLRAFAEGRLSQSAFLMPGCCGRGRGFRHGRGRRGGWCQR